MSPSPSCLRCRFFHLQPDHESNYIIEIDDLGNRRQIPRPVGECRANPPVTRGGDYPNSREYTQGIWPYVFGEEDWCGVFAERGAK